MHSILFKYALSGRVRRKTEQKVSWAAVARVSQEAGFKGVMIIRYSVVPPRESCCGHFLMASYRFKALANTLLWLSFADLANPIFATTGMSFGYGSLDAFAECL